MDAATIQRFWSKVRFVADDCWEWTGALRSKVTGYGAFKAHGRLWDAHRFAATLRFGELPRRCFVCHHCDNRRCVNPRHLFVGTRSNNMADAARKGRLPSATLNADKVRAIRRRLAEGGTHTEVASEYGVSRICISELARGRTWSHVADVPSAFERRYLDSLEPAEV